ncbi:hypothetical protein PIIN_09268 [Serendipita indica DSM 11827]|uniref:Uncharacterized protein n=1 Tax=Serendipita indica (strain DSM 11827) TaxID=1109443 RepID=G4TVE1_SERID|nr:hypothetical protein PIIN_09268 [Serendipita indica DSM 11827]
MLGGPDKIKRGHPAGIYGPLYSEGAASDVLVLVHTVKSSESGISAMKRSKVV